VDVSGHFHVAWAVSWSDPEPRTFWPIDIFGRAVSAHQMVSQQQTVSHTVTYNVRKFNILWSSTELVVIAVEVAAVVVIVK
jgi:hypothetical protein